MRLKFITFRDRTYNLVCPICGFMHRPFEAKTKVNYLQCKRCDTKFYYKKIKDYISAYNFKIIADHNVIFGKFINYDKMI